MKTDDLRSEFNGKVTKHYKSLKRQIFTDDYVLWLESIILDSSYIYTVKFEGIDDWNRPVFKDINSSNRFGSTEILFPDKKLAPNNTPEEITNFFKSLPKLGTLAYFGNKFNCEPYGTVKRTWYFEFV
jgi:hypothetical protein